MTTTHDTAPRRAGTMRVVRSRGALSGFLLLLLGIWGALIPFVGPYFHYAFTPNSAWVMTSGRFWLELLPGIATAIAGLLIMTTANRSVGVFAGWLASIAGAWFILGPILGRLWDGSVGAAGTPIGGTARQVWEQIGFFSGLGTAILFLGALALGRFTVTSLRDLRAAERARTPEPAPAARTAPVAAAPVAAAPAGSAALRDDRVDEPTRDVRTVRETEPTRGTEPAREAEPVAVAGRHSHSTGATDTATADGTAVTRPGEPMTRPAAEVTRPQGVVGGEEAVRSDTVRGEGAHSETGGTAGATRDDALGTRRD